MVELASDNNWIPLIASAPGSIVENTLDPRETEFSDTGEKDRRRIVMPSLTTAGPASRSHSTPEQPLRKPAAPGLLAGAGAEAEEPEPAGAPAAPPPPFDELPVQAPSAVPPATTTEPTRTDRRDTDLMIRTPYQNETADKVRHVPCCILSSIPIGFAGQGGHDRGARDPKRWSAHIFHPPSRMRPVPNWRNDAIVRTHRSRRAPERSAPATFSPPRAARHRPTRARLTRAGRRRGPR